MDWTDKEPRCCKEVWRGVYAHKCKNKAKYLEGGKWYCGIHAPSQRAKRRKPSKIRWIQIEY